MIKKFENIILIGTSHVAKTSAKQIEDSIDEYKPEIVAIELDNGRLHSLLEREKIPKKKSFLTSFKLIKQVGVSGYLFAIVAGYIQEKIGKSLGIKPGIDMKTAYLKSVDLKIPISLIDIDIKITLKKISKVSFLNKIKTISTLFFKSMSKSEKKKYNLDLDLDSGVPDEEMISTLLSFLKANAPIFYKILIDDRNEFMVKNLKKLQDKTDKSIICVVGAGHIEGMLEILNKNKPKLDLNQEYKLESFRCSVSYG